MPDSDSSPLRTVARRSLGTGFAVCVLLLASSAARANADSRAVDTSHPKPSALAPRHTNQHSYGAPIKPPILHKGHKRAHAAAPKKAERAGP
jgi:hypothetical protein